MVYATYSTGYRPGGNNRRPGIVPYQADTLTNYESGWKTTWADNRCDSTAPFSTRLEKVQDGIQGLNGITSIFNVGDADVKGIEGELSWLAMQGLTLSLSGTYVDAKTSTRYCPQPNGVVTQDCPAAGSGEDGEAKANSGTQLPVTPEFKGNLPVATNSWPVASTASSRQLCFTRLTYL